MDSTSNAAQETIDFGGQTWIKRDGEEIYTTEILKCGKATISQYGEESSSAGKWHCLVWIDKAMHKLDLRFAENHISRIANTRDDAMTDCINALDDYLNDLRLILLKLDPTSDYARGYADGKAALAFTLQAEILAQCKEVTA